jgi:hypothetical protein
MEANVSFISALERIIAANICDVIDVAMSVDGRTRARIAVFCFSRGHLREKSIAIASKCRLSDLIAESTPHVAQSLHAHADPVVSRERQRRPVSLAAL